MDFNIPVVESQGSRNINNQEPVKYSCMLQKLLPNRLFAWHGHVTLSVIKTVVTQNEWQKQKERVEISKIAKFEAPDIKEWFFYWSLNFWKITKIQYGKINVAGEQGLLSSNIFHTNPSNFPKIQAATKSHSAVLGASNFSTFIFLTCSFHFWQLFCTTTVFDDWQGHVTVSCKEPITETTCLPSLKWR